MHDLERFKVNGGINRTTNNVYMGRVMVLFSHLQPILVSKPITGCHSLIVWKFFLYVNLGDSC